MIGCETCQDTDNERYNSNEKFSIFLNIFLRYFNGALPLQNIPNKRLKDPAVTDELLNLRTTLSTFKLSTFMMIHTSAHTYTTRKHTKTL